MEIIGDGRRRDHWKLNDRILLGSRSRILQQTLLGVATVPLLQSCEEIPWIFMTNGFLQIRKPSQTGSETNPFDYPTV
ncbi:hypothetical protein NPIL_275861 [Nephila pilipes]|uniref:Uncharacterized protein n=1 Tax=Nephila pilipes TaxID=299642 RepID=A0A8X6QCL6_NEPPI|nr:hypothetical protein NPIL_275861 [Nephila pilipes]